MRHLIVAMASIGMILLPCLAAMRTADDEEMDWDTDPSLEECGD